MIRKTALLVTGTIAGVVGVVSYNPPQLDNAIASGTATPAPQTPTSTESAPSSQAQSSSKAKAPSPKKSSTTSPTPETTQSTSAGVSGTFQGDTSQTRWGPVQVQITVSDGKITDVSTLQYPNGDRRSQMISSQVIPWLQQEALQVQSANISGISGASYTSRGFTASLASALQKAGL